MTQNLNPKGRTAYAAEHIAVVVVVVVVKAACMCMHVFRIVFRRGQKVFCWATKRQVTQTKLRRGHAPAPVPYCQNPDTQHLAPFASSKRDASASYRHGFRHGTKNGLLCNLLVSGYRCISRNRDMMVRKIHCDIAVIVRAG